MALTTTICITLGRTVNTLPLTDTVRLFMTAVEILSRVVTTKAHLTSLVRPSAVITRRPIVDPYLKWGN
jgi:hypothetical protein